LAVVLRQIYLYQSSKTRLLEMLYWPTLDLLLWGFVSIYIQRVNPAVPRFVAYFVGALILWNILFRAQQGITVSFLEDIWSRNLTNVFISPLSIAEYLSGLILISLLKVLIAFTVMTTIAGLFYSFNIFSLGISLLPLVINLLAMGWAVGICTMTIILRFGQEAEVLAWAIAFLFMPFSAVYYPVEVLPPALRVVAWFLPSAHAFEGMRSIIQNGLFPTREILLATGLNLVYLALACQFFTKTHRKVLQLGIIPKIGE
jgi:ABC-2 type transport system permease protein